MDTLSRIAMLVDVASALYPRTSNTLKAIGLLVVLRQIVNLLLSLYRAFLRRRRNLPQRYGRNSWALITGSSEGIGKGIALNLAKQGFNIILSARSEFKLDVARCDIRRACPQVDIKTFVMDYSRAAEPEYLQQRLNELYGLDVAIVVNNVGVDVLDHYHELTEKQVLNLININCTAAAQMNRLFIPRMLERYNKRGQKSAIVNVASLAGMSFSIQERYPCRCIMCTLLPRRLWIISVGLLVMNMRGKSM